MNGSFLTGITLEYDNEILMDFANEQELKEYLIMNNELNAATKEEFKQSIIDDIQLVASIGLVTFSELTIDSQNVILDCIDTLWDEKF